MKRTSTSTFVIWNEMKVLCSIFYASQPYKRSTISQFFPFGILWRELFPILATRKPKIGRFRPTINLIINFIVEKYLGKWTFFIISQFFIRVLAGSRRSRNLHDSVRGLPTRKTKRTDERKKLTKISWWIKLNWSMKVDKKSGNQSLGTHTHTPYDRVNSGSFLLYGRTNVDLRCGNPGWQSSGPSWRLVVSVWWPSARLMSAFVGDIRWQRALWNMGLLFSTLRSFFGNEGSNPNLLQFRDAFHFPNSHFR